MGLSGFLTNAIPTEISDFYTLKSICITLGLTYCCQDRPHRNDKAMKKF